MRTVKILLVSSHPVQYATPLYRLYSADPRLDVTVAYCSLQGAEPGIDREFGVEVAWDVPLLNGYCWVHPPNRSPRPSLHGFSGLLNPGLWGLIRNGRFDVVVCYGYGAASFWIAALAAKVSGAALVFTTDAHTLAPRDGARWKAFAKRVVLPLVFRLADGAFGPSTGAVGLLRMLGVGAGSVFLTPFVVATEFFSNGALGTDRARVRMAWGISPDAFVALFCGKLVSWKRPQDLLEAISRSEGVHAVFAGDGPLRIPLETRAAQPNLSGKAKFLGFVNQTALPQTYAASDVLVLPSEYEPFGVVINEAFACGLPAIVSEACGSAGDLVRNGETGYVVPVGAVDVLAERLHQLAANAKLRAEMTRKARARIADWGPEQNTEAFANACLVLAARRSPLSMSHTPQSSPDA